MQKAHLYEAILLVNRGIDQAVQALGSVEERRRIDCKPPKVRFLTDEEQKEWELGAPDGPRDPRS
jgi:hypothetical protein